jgi:hypothetical protein
VNVLLDHCVPKPFGRLLTGHFVRTSEFMGWDHLQNGDLLDAAAPQYEVLVTVDKSMRFEQHLGDLPMTVISLVARTNRAIDLAPLSPEVLRLLGTKLQRRVYVVGPLGPHPTP